MADRALAAFSEGFCLEGHRLEPTWMHDGEFYGSCYACGASWRVGGDGRLWGCACVPGDHTCGIVS